jgi:hypothetical protein
MQPGLMRGTPRPSPLPPDYTRAAMQLGPLVLLRAGQALHPPKSVVVPQVSRRHCLQAPWRCSQTSKSSRIGRRLPRPCCSGKLPHHSSRPVSTWTCGGMTAEQHSPCSQGRMRRRNVACRHRALGSGRFLPARRRTDRKILARISVWTAWRISPGQPRSCIRQHRSRLHLSRLLQECRSAPIPRQYPGYSGHHHHMRIQPRWSFV